MRHPFLNDHGQPVTIHLPSLPTCLTTWSDPTRIATVVPGGALPEELGGIPFRPWTGSLAAPTSPVAEPPYVLPAGMAAAAGVVTVEEDGRVWLVSPTNGFGGYEATFPKGRVDPGTSLQHTAIREAFEESGLAVDLTAWLLDMRRTQTFTRYYLARRIGGSPAAMGWETQAVHLVPLARLGAVAAHPNDAVIIQALEHMKGTP
ncbi:NUDIX hydrolase [Massilia niabensis]|uniref:NUDIX hydrolase n=1 Tax=Massilia niabensis TaxID=544910 RepID=A0ABW0L5P5_9BURK